MLYVAIGSLWVVSIICMLFLAAYIYQLTRRQLDAGNNSYFWTVLRTIIVFCIGLSVFYFGVASRVESLPNLVAYRLQIRPIPLWSAEAWVSLSLAFGICAILFAVTDTLRTDLSSHHGWRLRWRDVHLPFLSLRIPDGLSWASPKRSSDTIDNTSSRYFSQADQFWALANVLVGLFTGCFLFVGLQTVSQVNFVQALGIQGDFGTGIAFNQRVRPTPTPDIPNQVPTDISQGNLDDSANAAGVAQAPIEVASRSRLQSDQQSVAQLAPQSTGSESVSQPSSAPSSLQSASTEQNGRLTTDAPATGTASDANAPLPDLPPTLDSSVDASPVAAPEAQLETFVLINEPLGVNARRGPGTTFGVITILQNGTRHALLERSGDGQWLNIQLPGATDGWVASWVVEVSP